MTDAPVRLPTGGMGRRTAAATAGVTDLFRAIDALGMPVLDLLIRLWIAQAFWVSGMRKVLDWELALNLARYEYPVSWMSPELAAWIGAGIEVVFPVLLAFGLATRLAALALLALTAVIQVEYVATEIQTFWILLLGWLVIRGAGPLSLDHPFGRGFARLPVPGVALAYRVARWLRIWVLPAYLVLMRVWMAIIFFDAGLTRIGDWGSQVFLFQHVHPLPFLAPGVAAAITAAAELALPVLLAIGLFGRLSALGMLVMTMTIQWVVGSFDPAFHLQLHYYWLMVFGILVLGGVGPLSLDRALGRLLHRRYPGVDDVPGATLEQLPQVVIVGAGFGGVTLARSLRHAPCRVTLIDRRNYHLFQPLLYQVATAGLAPSDIATPIRSMFRDQNNARVLMGRVTDVDTDAKVVLIGDSRIPYDHLVLATGARHSYFGKNEWEPYAPGLKKIDDATDIRRRLLTAFERAETAETPEERNAWLTFVVVGGGPTGVELAGAIAELAHTGLTREFRSIDPASARVLLVQSAPRLLPPFPERLSAVTKRALERLGVEVLLGRRVDAVDDERVMIGEDRIAARTVFWAAGVAASPAAKWVKGEVDRSGRLKVGPDLSVPGDPDVFAIGDTALSQAWDGNPVPGLAPAAKQGGAYVGRVLKARLAGRRAPKPFRYKHMGNLATIGRSAAVVDFGWLKLSGPLAWWLWGLAHIMFLQGAQNRISVAIEWFWAYLTYQRRTRLITGSSE